MLYSEYIIKAKELTIGYDEEAMAYYLEPDWQTILHSNGLGDLENIKDMYIEGWYDLEDVLKLEVEKRNSITSKQNIVLNWLYDIITSTAEPALTDVENEFFQKLLNQNEKEEKSDVSEQ